MLNKPILRALPVLFLVSVLGYLGYALTHMPHFSGMYRYTDEVQRVEIENGSAIASTAVPQLYHYSVYYDWRAGDNTQFHIIPDDCLNELYVNGKSYSLSRFTRTQLCDYNVGVTVDLRDVLQPGFNHFQITVEDTVPGGVTGLRIKPALWDETHINGTILWYCLIIAALWWPLMCWLGISPVLQIMQLASIYLIVTYFAYTPGGFWGYDLAGHIDYIQYLVKNHKLPPVQSWGIYYHPPLYYLYSAGWYSFAQEIEANPLHYVRLGSIFLYLTFQLMALRSVMLVSNRPYLHWIAAALILFWPQTGLKAGMITNDIMIGATWAGSVFFLLRWLKLQQLRDFGYHLLWLALAVGSKNNSVILLATTPCILMIQCLLKRKAIFAPGMSKRLLNYAIRISPYALVLFLAIGANYGRIWEYKKEHPEIQWVVANYVGQPSQWEFPTQLSSFVKPERLIAWPWPETWNGELHSNDYWSHMVKTWFYGEHSMGNIEVARAVNACFVVFILSLMGTLFYTARRKWRECYPAYIAITMTFAAAIINLVVHPIFATADARYIYPVLIWMVVLFMQLCDEPALLTPGASARIYPQRILLASGIILGLIFFLFNCVQFLLA